MLVFDSMGADNGSFDSVVPKGYGEVLDVPVKILDLKAWRDEWVEENDPMDGSDCVTPFDKYLY